MARPKTNNKALTIRLNKNVIKSLEKHCRTHNTTPSHILQHLLRKEIMTEEQWLLLQFKIVKEEIGIINERLDIIRKEQIIKQNKK